MNTYKNKTRINPRIDEKLIRIMKRHCKCEKIPEQDFIASAIADKLNIRLNLNFMIDEGTYAEHQIKEIDNCIKQLEAKKREYEEELK